jgi:hypothetical protein
MTIVVVVVVPVVMAEYDYNLRVCLLRCVHTCNRKQHHESQDPTLDARFHFVLLRRLLLAPMRGEMHERVCETRHLEKHFVLGE